ncbi:unnamed protein product [Paramecium pentaurelia]|uniref:Uncharacterized protein n=1 Tax=Paramecium pentaurelia TaxID=43138 RepID=A0A8S1UW81_9CILI|nr:unnamed protein product [Paramecium pentaurelia]
MDQNLRMWISVEENIKVSELNQLDGHSSCVNSVCISPDGNTFTFGSVDQSYPFIGCQNWIRNQILCQELVSNYSILVISQVIILKASDTHILQGEFINHQGKDLKPLFKSKGSCFLKDLQKK